MLQCLRGDIGDQRGRRRCTDLVGHHPQRIALGAHAQHGAQEVRAVRGIHPRRAKDQMAATGRTHRVLAIALARAIHAQRCGRLVLAVGRAALAVEHVVGGVVHERHAMRRTPARDHAWCLRVGGEGRIDVLFGAINSGVSRRIDHYQWLHAVQQCRQAVGLAEIGRFTGTSVGSWPLRVVAITFPSGASARSNSWPTCPLPPNTSTVMARRPAGDLQQCP